MYVILAYIYEKKNEEIMLSMAVRFFFKFILPLKLFNILLIRELISQ